MFLFTLNSIFVVTASIGCSPSLSLDLSYYFTIFLCIKSSFKSFFFKSSRDFTFIGTACVLDLRVGSYI